MNVLILAAGLGTRMKSKQPKVLHKIFDRPIIDYVIDTAKKLNPEKVFVVLNPSMSEVVEYCKDKDIEIVFQPEPKGTANAVAVALPKMSKQTDIMILNGDTPLIKNETLEKFYEFYKRDLQDLAVLSFYPERQHSYGRIKRDIEGKVEKIVEITDIDEKDRLLKEANSGVYLAKSEVLKLIEEIKENPRKKEFYLTDIVELARKKEYKIEAYCLADEKELIGINTRYELYLAMKYLRDRLVSYWMENGVSFYDPYTVWISPSVTIGEDSVIHPNVILEGNTRIGQKCVIYQSVRIKDSTIEDSVQIKDCTVIENSYIKSNSQIGPFAHIRPETVIGEGCRIGNFVEIKKSTIGDGTKAAHLSYLGDSVVGNNVNIGAGTITCNYDGKKKHKTVIEDNVFVGSDTQLVAPVKIGKGAYIGAGSTVTKDVPEDALAISRTPQKNIDGWAKKKREK